MANEHAIQATGTFVVSKGFRLLTKLAASQGSLQFTRAAVGTGKPPEGYSPESMIGLNAYKIDAEIADYGVQDDMAYITVQVSSDNVTEGFLVTEVGVFAEDPDEGEILYGYMDISTDPTYIYANGSTNRSKFAEFTLYVLIGSVSNVIAAVTPGSIITRDTFTAANLKAIDTHGILGGEAGAGTTGQGLIDALTNKLLTEFVTNTGLMERLGTYVLKSKIVNDFLSTDEETVLSGPMGKLLKEQLNVLNTNLSSKAGYGKNVYTGQQYVITYAGIDDRAYLNMQFVSEAPWKENNSTRAGYGFHNSGSNGGALSLDTDGRLKFVTSDTHTVYALDWHSL